MMPETTNIENDATAKRWGWAISSIGLGGALLWAGLAPLDAGVSSPGMVVVAGNRKVVQPVASGKISSILVKDGDSVTEGQPVIELDPTQSRSQLDIAEGQWLSTHALLARLHAERDHTTEFRIPSEVPKNLRNDARAISAVELQQQLMLTRRKTLESEMAAMMESKKGLELQTVGLESSLRTKETQLKLLRGQLLGLTPLADEGYVAQNRVLEVQLRVSILEGTIAEDTGNVGKNKRQVLEIQDRISTLQQSQRKEIETLLVDAQKEVSALKSRIEALKADLANTVMTSPADGTVMGLTVHTVGGVVATGTPVMEVVPVNEALKIETQIAPHLIDKVKAGLEVDVLFTALNQVSTPKIPGKVIHVSADVMLDTKQNFSYYKARIEVTPDGVNLLRNHEIKAGMPVEVFIRTGERTALNYLIKPLADRLNSSMTEP